MLRRTSGLWILIALVVGVPSAARADERWLLSLDGALAVPVSRPQSDIFQPGASASVTLWRSLASPIALGVRARGGFLADGPAPVDDTLADPGLGTLLSLTLGGRMRLEPAYEESDRRGTGPFVDAMGGLALTGALVRPTIELGVGYGIEIGDVDLAPTVRWSTVLETESQLAPGDAHLLLVGLEITFLDHRPVVIDTEASPPGPSPRPSPPPDPDVDRDGISNAADACPTEPEDLDGLEDEDGCPDDDVDGDGILDRADRCPTEREIVNGVDDGDGCPDEGLIELVDDRIVLEERVLFDLNRARIRRRATPVLEAIVALYHQHPEWAELRIEGHADSQGERWFNQRLSERRARRVRDALVDRGIPDGIITSVGYGETRPRAWGWTEEVHRANRRVEFVVVRRIPEPQVTTGGAR